MSVEGILRDLGRGESEPLDGAYLKESASIARDQILRCRGITQHFLRMSRGQSSPGNVVQVSSAIEAARRLIAPTARAHAVAVEVRDPGDTLNVRADEAELQNLLINLMLNAIQASKPGGRIDVTVVADGALRIRVADQGCGIAPEFRGKIFEPFFSLRKGGTGLGLFLSLNFVRRFGGNISVESAPGEGSTFEVVFPLLPEAAPLEAGA